MRLGVMADIHGAILTGKRQQIQAAAD